MEQVVIPDINKTNEKVNSVDGKLEKCIDTVEKLVAE